MFFELLKILFLCFDQIFIEILPCVTFTSILFHSKDLIISQKIILHLTRIKERKNKIPPLTKLLLDPNMAQTCHNSCLKHYEKNNHFKGKKIKMKLLRFLTTSFKKMSSITLESSPFTYSKLDKLN